MSRADEALFVNGVESFFWKGRSFEWNLISTRLTQFSYFDRQLGRPAWKGRRVLDFGGNVGTFLAGAGDRVDHEDYWCVDLNRAVIEQGRRTYPRAHFVHYDRYSPQYNPRGTRRLPVPDLGVKFDFILAFSVFTHVDRRELIELVGSLRRMLSPGGVLAFTFFDPHYDRSLADPTQPPGSAVGRYFNSRSNGRRGRRPRWYVLIDEELYVEPGDEFYHQTRLGKPLESYCSFFAADYIGSLFPEATVLPPVSPEYQHCCVLKYAR
ncbi:MAG: class I SAM-dependent methyltransferase [Acidobacteriota bacterium]|nr:class I SAM-dependent methyltransferase [Acidobacteriota bacterium]